MSDQDQTHGGADALFPGFEIARLRGAQAAIHYRVAGDGPPLLLLHGFPQNGAMWARAAKILSAKFRVVVPDLRGYGRSRGPVGEAHYTKRVMAEDFLWLMESLGCERFGVAGHDRGGRVAYRMALDHPDRVTRLAVLDILPTYEYWAAFGHAFALKTWHWPFLAQPFPVPEKLISGAPEFFVDRLLADWSGAEDLRWVEPEALESYRHFMRDPTTLRAMCDDYRAGARADFEHDSADRESGRRIAAPTLALWGAAGLAGRAGSPLDVWRAWCSGALQGAGVDCGHFLPEERPAETAAALADFFAG